MAVQRGVQDLQSAAGDDLRLNSLGHDGLIVLIDEFLANIVDLAGRHSLVKIHTLNLKDVGLLHGCKDRIGALVGHLTAIGAIGLEAIVLGAVVAGSDHDARAAAQGTNRVREHRGWHQFSVEPDLDAVGGQNGGRMTGNSSLW